MKAHTTDFKNTIKQFGREIDSKISYQIGGVSIELGKEQINSITPHYESSLLKSVMKQLDIDSNIYIPPETVINYQFGLKVGNSYEYINYGNYVVYEVEKQEDTRSWKITCYDKMLYAMKDYENLGITYPITVKNFLSALCTKIGLTLADGDFVNQDKEITSELYLDSEGNSLGYTYRSVLDELAQVTASTICINEDDELEVRYPSNAGTYTTVEGTSLSLANCDDGKDIVYDLKGDTQQASTPTPTNPVEVQNVTGRQDINVCQKNLLDLSQVIIGKAWNNASSTARAVVYVKCQPSTQYTISFDSISGFDGVYNFEKVNISDTTATSGVSQITATKTITTQATSQYIGIQFNKDSVSTNDFENLKMQVEKGNATTYEAYNGNTYEINLGKNLIDTSKFENKNNTNITQISTGVRATFIGSQGTYRWAYYKIPNSTDFFGKTCTITANIYNSASNKGSIRVWQLDSNNNAIGNQIGTALNSSGSVTITFPSSFSSGAVSFGLLFYSNVDGTLTNGDYVDYTNLQFELGSIATSYSPYKTPIELCKIGNYQDFIRKGTGKNLLNIQGIVKGRLDSGNIGYESSVDTLTLNENSFSFTTNANNRGVTTDYIAIESGSYTISSDNLNSTYSLKVACYNGSKIWFQDATFTGNSSEKRRIITIPSGTSFIRIYFALSSAGSITITNPQLEKGNAITLYEPYGFKDKWYLYKAIDKIVLNGSENWTKSGSTAIDRFFIELENGTLSNYNIVTAYSNRFYYSTNALVGTIQLGDYQGNTRLFLDYSTYGTTTLQQFKTWLSTNNTEVYYVLTSPTITKITDTELLSQLNSIELLEGLNNISITSGNLSTPLTLTYLSELETINEEYLKDVNVNFGEKYGKVNSVVLSRSAESDNIYRSDEESIEENGLTEIKIKDNQILNGNNRDEYIDGIFNQLNGLEYYINDFKSTGITYLDLLDKYKVKVEENYYKCIMLNDELDVTQGIEEQVYAEMPEETETDYTHASKTDRTINQAYIIAKKNNAEIQALAKKVVDVSDTITGIGSVTLENAHNGVIHRIEITGNISRLMPSNTLTPSGSLHPIDVCLLVDEDRYYLDIDYLVYNSIEEHDTFICEDGKCWIERINGTIEEKNDIYIYVDSNSEIRIEYFDNARIKCIYLLQNDYTDVFSNEATVSSELNLLANSFEAKVSEVTDTEGNITSSSIILAINNDVSSAVINADKISLEGKEINLTSEDIKIQSDNFSLDENGNMECNNAKINGGEITLYGGTQTPKIKLINPTDESQYSLYSSGVLRFMNNEVSRTYLAGTQGLLSLRDFQGYNSTFVGGEIYLRNELEETPISMTARTGNITCVSLTQTSKAEEKKNFEKLENALDIIENTDIYQYHLKRQNDNEKKHIGFIIGDEYNYSEKITSQENNAVDVYSFVAVCCQAIKELQEEINNLKKEMNK